MSKSLSDDIGGKVAQLVMYRTSNQWVARSIPDRLWSVLRQDSLFHIASVHPNGYLALIRQCLELVRYMLPAALAYPSGDCIVLYVY